MQLVEFQLVGKKNCVETFRCLNNNRSVVAESTDYKRTWVVKTVLMFLTSFTLDVKPAFPGGIR